MKISFDLISLEFLGIPRNRRSELCGQEFQARQINCVLICLEFLGRHPLGNRLTRNSSLCVALDQKFLGIPGNS